MSTPLTDQEQGTLTDALLYSVTETEWLALCAAVGAIAAARVAAERDRLLGKLEALADESFDAYLSVAPMVRMRVVAANPLRALVAEERAT